MRLALVEILDRDGHVRQAVSVEQWPVTIGRAIDCDVVLDDPHVAAKHATVTDEDGALSLHLGDSVNGARLLNRPVCAGTTTVLPSGEVFQLGGTRVRVRRASDPLAPERALAPVGGRISLLVLAVALLARTVAEQWLDTDPGGRLIEYVPWLVGGAALLALWCGVWAVGSKLFHHRFEFSAHARIAMSYLLALGVTGLLLPLAGYALSWSFLSRITGFVAGALLCAMVWQHLTLILPSRRRVLALIMGTLFVAGSAVILSHNYQANDRYFTELYDPTLAPPALRLAPAVTTERFIDESRRLKAVLDAHAGDDNGSDGWGID
jgi:pSer/pThr/pTyr-binding forkhead associated (FHA) protein